MPTCYLGYLFENNGTPNPHFLSEKGRYKHNQQTHEREEKQMQDSHGSDGCAPDHKAVTHSDGAEAGHNAGLLRQKYRRTLSDKEGRLWRRGAGVPASEHGAHVPPGRRRTPELLHT